MKGLVGDGLKKSFQCEPAFSFALLCRKFCLQHRTQRKCAVEMLFKGDKIYHFVGCSKLPDIIFHNFGVSKPRVLIIHLLLRPYSFAKCFVSHF